ncbi:alpha amylase C-terminal domain-containing protein [Algoriphagus aestuariicola]|uniref:1,4-alpha-glucan branching enzyme n=1 Tax=Algoriphagus aestuariicola TaxID=1852016 RepID=A0ABS3BLK8_9BACT|nr:alpha-amylase family glycosyl hydrolase [Algoriphagus aestuariicola]MBN7799714.1 alpha amylase C-terminal domain-containing protein [Algoriphagus aestuariicola]
MTQQPLPLIQDNTWLEPFAPVIEARYERFRSTLHAINDFSGNILEFARMHEYYGVHFDKFRNGWIYREWAPEAKGLFLTGDFNWWDRNSHPLRKNHRGDWEIFLPYADYKDNFVHQSRIKVRIIGANDTDLDRIPAHITRVVQDEETHDFSGQLWFPEEKFNWTDQNFSLQKTFEMPLIYECHVGMAQEKLGVGTYKEFEENILPRIKAGGYNAIQLMAVMEHPYYGSFGYHVSNFFAPSSRFGTPEELKSLINAAHRMGIAVIMDIVHSHAVKNVNEGLNEFDGTDDQYFHSGDRGYHEGWDSKLFNYGKWEVQQFLLSNIRYWLEEFHFDGFRFDGATSMLYHHHGHVSFDSAEKYFDAGVDEEALLYFQLANTLIHSFKPNALSIAEEVSGMPGLSRTVSDGGIGFDFRLAMGIPDFWIKTLKHKPDEQWDMFELWHELTNRPAQEKSIAYAESHDQALVGDKSIAFWLMDKEMYFSMTVLEQNLVVDRGIALHKMIRMITLSLGGEGYLNFIGNEFGHPEWVDFPRLGNDWSYQYARRQWSLVDDPLLRYRQMGAWDEAMIHLAIQYRLLSAAPAQQLHLDPDKKILAYERGGLIFVFSFHPSESFFGFPIHIDQEGNYRILLHSDEKDFGGFERLDKSIDYPTDANHHLHLYIPNRVVMVMERKK